MDDIGYSSESRQAEDLIRLVKSAKGESDRRFVELSKLYLALVEDVISYGSHPLTGEHKGSYAFFDRNGVLKSMSRRAERIFGYESGESNLEEIIDVKDMGNFLGLREETTVDELKIKTKKGVKTITGVHVMPIWVGKLEFSRYLGSVVDFKTISNFERLKNWRKK